MEEVRGLHREWVEMVLGVVYMRRKGVGTWYDAIMDWLMGQNQELQQRGCRIILGGGEGGGGVGDLNGHISNREQAIKGNKEKINVNGSRVLELTKDTELEIVNRWEGSVGKWTSIEGMEAILGNNVFPKSGLSVQVQ